MSKFPETIMIVIDLFEFFYSSNLMFLCSFRWIQICGDEHLMLAKIKQAMQFVKTYDDSTSTLPSMEVKHSNIVANKI